MALLPLLKKRLGTSLFLPAHGRGQALPRLIQVLWTLSGLVIVLLLRGSSSDADVQRGLARRILNTLTGLGPC